MPRFEDALRSVADRLDLPQPERARILQEISGDLEDLRTELIGRGLGEAEAEARALEILTPSEPALAALTSVHDRRRLVLGCVRGGPGDPGNGVGIAVAAQTVEALGEVHASLVWGGIRLSLMTTMYGFFVLLGAALLWFGLRHWHRRSVLSAA